MKIKHLIGTTLLFTSVACTSFALSGSAQNAILRGNNPDSQINLRSAPTTNSRKLGYGLVGDSVTILERSRGSNGYTWYKVQFPRSKAIGWIRGDFVNPVTTQGEQAGIIQKARANLNQQIRSLKNGNSGYRLTDRRSSAQIQEKDDFVTTWQKIDPQTAPFLGSWSGYETFWNIYPSKKKGHVCVIRSEQGFINLYFGKVTNNELHFDISNTLANHNSPKGNKKYISFREGDYLGMGYIKNNQFMSVNDVVLNSPTKPEEPSNLYDMNVNQLSSSSPIVKSFKKLGCTASLPKNNNASQTNIENLGDGYYLYGEVPHPDGFGKQYVVFGKSGKSITGISYVTNTDNIYCFQGMAKGDRIINATSVMTIINPPKSYDEITPNISIDLNGFYFVEKSEESKRESVEYCSKKIDKAISAN